MIAFTDEELVNIGAIVLKENIINDDKQSYIFAVNELRRRKDYLYPLVVELAKKVISLKDIDGDLYDEYLIIISLLDRSNNLFRYTCKCGLKTDDYLEWKKCTCDKIPQLISSTEYTASPSLDCGGLVVQINTSNGETHKN